MSSIHILSLPAALAKESSDRYLEHQSGLLLEDYFRRWLGRHAQKNEGNADWHYLPVGWTALENRYRALPRPLRKYLGLSSMLYKRLNRVIARVCSNKRRVFTVCQHARGVEIDKRVHRPENLLVFSSGGTGHVPLPLLCDKRDHPPMSRNLLASFQGVVRHPRNSYPWRDAMAREFTGRAAVEIVDTEGQGTGRSDYLELLARSRFCLCPRGYGRTSFRLMEAMHAGCVPVYIHAGDAWLPFQDLLDWSEFCVLVDYRNIEGLYNHLNALPTLKVEAMAARAKQVSDEYFTLEFASRYVLSTLNAAPRSDLEELMGATAVLREQQCKDHYTGPLR